MLRDGGLALAAAAAVLAFVLALLTVRVDGLSMLPTIHDGDMLLVDRLAPRLQAPHRGDIVVVLQPNGVAAVKRVIGVPGDRLEIDGSRRRPGGDAPSPVVLVEPGGRGPWLRLREPYVGSRWTRADFCCGAQGRDAGTSPQPVTLPDGQFFVMGDNRNASRDSRDFGLVAGDRIVARVLVRYWPPGRAGVPASGTALTPS